MSVNQNDRLDLIVPGTVDYLDVIREFVSNHAREAGFSDEDHIDEIVLSLDEAVANIVEHAYDESDLPIEEQTINILIEINEKEFVILLRDHGIPYDPTIAPEIDLEHRNEIGHPDGRGVYIIRKLMDEMSYEYHKETGNTLKMVKYIK